MRMGNSARGANRGWRLDYFVIDDKSFKAVKDSSINSPILGSDHCPIELTLKVKEL